MRALCLIRKEPVYRRQSFEDGLRRVGFKLATSLVPESPEDWLIIWNRKAGRDEAQANQWEALGGTVIVAENGYLQKVDKTTYAISVHGHNGSGWFPVGDEDRFSKFGFPIKPWRAGGTEIVIRGQRGIGSTLMASPPNWAEKIAHPEVRRLTSVPVRVIPHPGNHAPKVDPVRDLSHAFAMVIWCSSMGVLALVEGIPVFYAAPRWVCSEGGSPLSRFPAQPPVDQRKAALHRMSHGQWGFEEIATGEPFARIIAHRKEAVW